MYNNALFIFLFIIRLLSTKCDNVNEDNDWDVLVFTQRWPITACAQWLRENANNSCLLPDYEYIWTVHGLWPTKSGTRGPWDCNATWHFDELEIAPIESDLIEFWINVENNTGLTSFWKHEWEKHGTCATILPQLNSELKFFKQGLEWIKMYNMKSILSQYDIVPSRNGYNVVNIFNAIRNILNHNPIVQCVVDKETKDTLLSEIQLCFDKSFDVIDCDVVKNRFENISEVGNILTDCSLKKNVYYPNKVYFSPNEIPITTSSSFENLIQIRDYWIRIYKTFKFVIWATI